MFTNKALHALKSWIEAVEAGRGEVAKRHLIEFTHVGAGLVASPEFQERCEDLLGRKFSPNELDVACRILDAMANIEVRQILAYGR